MNGTEPEVAMLPDMYPHNTHCQIFGRPDSGKSKIIEHCAIEHTIVGNGYCILDFSGTLYKNMLDFFAYVGAPPHQKIVLLNLSGDCVTPFNPFELINGGDVSAHASRMSEMALKSWGHDVNDMATFSDVAYAVFSYCAEFHEPIQHGIMLLEIQNRELLLRAFQTTTDDSARRTFGRLLNARPDVFEKMTQSTHGRLNRILRSKALLRSVGLPSQINIPEIIASGSILLVNLCPDPDMLSLEASRALASLILFEFLYAAIRNFKNPKPYFLYLDEAQEYVTKDVVSMLDLARKSGLRITLSHQHNGQERILPFRDSLDTSARIKFVFHGLPLPEQKRLAEDCMLMEINLPMILEKRSRMLTEFYEDEYEVLTDVESITIPANRDPLTSISSSRLRGIRSVPFQQEIEDNIYYSREDKIAMMAGKFRPPKQECLVILPDMYYRYRVPHTESWGPFLMAGRAVELLKTLQTHSIPNDEADRQLKTAQARFLERSRYADEPRKRKAKPVNLHPQG